MMMYRYGWIGLLLTVLLALLLAACGGDDNTPDESESQSVDGTPTSLFPPTWTPVPTRTEPPHATIEYTYEAPETALGAAPTRTPASQQQPLPTQPPLSTPIATTSSFAPLPTSSPTQLVISLEALNEAIGEKFNPLAGGSWEAAPEIRLEDEMIVAAVTIYTTAGRKDTARPVVIEMSVSVGSGRVALVSENVYFANDQTPYEDEDGLADYIMGAIETAINDLFNQQYLTVFPSGSEFAISTITFTDTSITAEYSA